MTLVDFLLLFIALTWRNLELCLRRTVAVEDEKTIPMSDVSPLDAIRIHNATWVLSNSEYTLTSSKSAAWDQSFFLMVLTHVLGDIHQPLHCSTRYREGSCSNTLDLADPFIMM